MPSSLDITLNFEGNVSPDLVASGNCLIVNLKDKIVAGNRYGSNEEVIAERDTHFEGIVHPRSKRMA